MKLSFEKKHDYAENAFQFTPKSYKIGKIICSQENSSFGSNMIFLHRIKLGIINSTIEFFEKNK